MIWTSFNIQYITFGPTLKNSISYTKTCKKIKNDIIQM